MVKNKLQNKPTHQLISLLDILILPKKSGDKMFFYIVSLTFVLHVALSMHVTVQHAESFENGIEKDRAIDPKGYRLENNTTRIILNSSKI